MLNRHSIQLTDSGQQTQRVVDLTTWPSKVKNFVPNVECAFPKVPGYLEIHTDTELRDLSKNTMR